jgi:APA family basic amino acid/polyamine antiporter
MQSLRVNTQASPSGLVRQLGFYSATALVISNMIGAGIFAYTGYMAGQLGRPGVLLACWSVGAIFALAGALSYSELGINFPSSGGEYVYLTHAFGPEWGFMTGWVSFFAGFSAPIAAAALAFSDYLGHFLPALQLNNAKFVFGSGDFSLKMGANWSPRY